MRPIKKIVRTAGSSSGIFRPLRGLCPRLDCFISRARLTVDPGALFWTWAAPYKPATR